MNIKSGAFISGLVGIAVISMITFGPIGYGKAPEKEYYPNGQLKIERSFKLVFRTF